MVRQEIKQAKSGRQNKRLGGKDISKSDNLAEHEWRWFSVYTARLMREKGTQVRRWTGGVR